MNIKLPCKLLSTGSFLPPQIVTSQQLETELGLPSGHYEAALGVRIRRRVTTENCSQLGAGALRQALERADLELSDLDVVIGASATMDYILPNRASSIIAEMTAGTSAPELTCVDVDATCISFLSGLHYAALLLQSDPEARIAVVSSEIAKYGLSAKRPEAYGLFGDGAAAAIVTGAPDRQAGIGAYRLRTYAAGQPLCVIRGGGNAYPAQTTPYSDEIFGFAMEGKPLLRIVQQELPGFIDAFVREAGGEGIEDSQFWRKLNLMVPHQTSRMGFRLLERALGDHCPPTVNCLEDLGNCIAASIPLALDHAVQTGRLQRGETCMLLGSAAGLSLGALTLTY